MLGTVCTDQSLYAAAIALPWHHYEELGLVKLDAEPEYEPYDDSYIDGYTDLSEEAKNEAKADIQQRLHNEGLWIAVSYFRLSAEDKWVQADSCGGFIGADYIGSGCDTDLQATALIRLNEAFQEAAEELAERATLAQ